MQITLAGLDDRANSGGSGMDVDLSRHIDDVVQTLWFESRRPQRMTWRRTSPTLGFADTSPSGSGPIRTGPMSNASPTTAGRRWTLPHTFLRCGDDVWDDDVEARLVVAVVGPAGRGAGLHADRLARGVHCVIERWERALRALPSAGA